DWKTFRGTQSSWKKYDYFQRPQDKPYTEGGGEQIVQCACLWGTISNASAGMGRMGADCHGVSPWSIFVRPESKIRKPQDLRDVPVAVGLRAGSHFNVPFRLEKYMPLERIKTVNVGGFGARLAALLNREIEAASLLPPQIDMAKQLGLREIIADEFHTLWWVPESAPKDGVRGYLNALERAERARGIRRGVRAGEALGSRPAHWGALLRKARLSRVALSRSGNRRRCAWHRRGNSTFRASSTSAGSTGSMRASSSGRSSSFCSTATTSPRSRSRRPS